MKAETTADTVGHRTHPMNQTKQHAFYMLYFFLSSLDILYRLDFVSVYICPIRLSIYCIAPKNNREQ